MIAGLLTPDRGSIAIDDTVLFDAAHGINVPPYRRRIATTVVRLDAGHVVAAGGLELLKDADIDGLD
jgi:hypothetical protein